MEKAQQAIASMQLENSHIAFYFACFWYQEDIEQLTESILTNLSKIQVLETIQGADRENVRFHWHEKFYFVLNFDCYSQSCWLEGEDEKSIEQLKHLMTECKTLKKS